MYGNTALPGYEMGNPVRDDGSIWRGYTEATWFETVPVGGSGAVGVPIPLGTLMIEDTSTNKYKAMTANDIISSAGSLPGARIGIIADTTAMTGTTTEVDGESVAVDSMVLIGIRGKVDEKRVLLGGTPLTELEEGYENLKRQLDVWGFQLVEVVEG